METQELQKYELVEAFLNSVRNAQSKQQFLSKVQEFDTRFTEDQITHTYSEKQKSVEKLPPMPQQKVKNPFKTNIDNSFRHQNSINNPINQNQTQQNFPYSQPQNPPPRGNYSRTQQNFYNPSSFKNEPYNQMNQMNQISQMNQMNNSYGYGTPNNQANTNYAGGMGILNYNAYSQKQYDDLKQQFFKQPNMNRNEPYSIQQSYGRQGDSFNYKQMNMGLGVSSSTEILGDHSNKPSARGFGERSNPFMRQ